MSADIEQVLAGFFSEASVVCGSEGLYQSIFYHQARYHFSQERIKREVSAEGGRVDFLLEGEDKYYAVELKAGANGHRNSLANMKEVEREGKGLQHDLGKLQSLQESLGKPVETWLLCVDLAALGIAFNAQDLEKYAEWSRAGGTSFAYVSQLEDHFKTNTQGHWSFHKLAPPPVPSKTSTWEIIQDESLWRKFFVEVERDHGVECSHVGLLYHALRRAGLQHNQVASEVFFNCNRYGARHYYRLDVAIFESSFGGQFQLYGNNRKTVENDQFKLPTLASLMEFKGGRSFCKTPISSRVSNIAGDLEKLANVVKPRIENAAAFQNRNPELPRPRYIMVVTDSDPNLEADIIRLNSMYNGLVDLQWPGGLLARK
jgi:hypothetical protein